jgi:hypothetical protein
MMGWWKTEFDEWATPTESAELEAGLVLAGTRRAEP